MEMYNLELEKSTLSSLMSIEDSYLAISHLVTANDFYAVRHQMIFENIAWLSNNNQPYDGVMLCDRLASLGLLESIGGEAYLNELLTAMPITLFNIKAYASRLRELSALRQAQQVLTQGQEVLDSSEPYADKINTLVESLTAIVDEKTTMKGAETVSDLMKSFFDQFQEYALSGSTPFVKTGFVELDHRVNIQAGELVIIAGSPGGGKTTLAQNILQNIVDKTQSTAVFFSLEMAKMQVMQRFMSSTSSVPLSKVKSGQGMTENDYGKLTEVANKYLSNHNLFIDDRGLLTISQMRSTLNKIRNKHGKIGVIMVDYIQIMGGIKGSTSGERSTSIADIANALKNFSKEYNCPVIALTQLNRESAKRPNRKPQMSDLAESSGIERVADHIWAIHREELTNPTNDNRGLADIIVLKQRQGALGTVTLRFEGQCSRFTDYIPQKDRFLEMDQ